MTTPDWPDPARGKKLRQLIGIARRQLGIEDDAHAARVRRLTGGRATSTTDCGLGELEAILREYKALGFVPTPPPGTGARPRRPAAAGSATAEPAAAAAGPAVAPSPRWQSPTSMLPKIGALLRTLNDLSDVADRKDFAYAAGILRQQKGLPKGIACPLELATADELRGVIAALHRQLKREQAKRQAPAVDVDAATAWLAPAHETP